MALTDAIFGEISAICTDILKGCGLASVIGWLKKILT